MTAALFLRPDHTYMYDLSHAPRTDKIIDFLAESWGLGKTSLWDS